MKKWSLALVVVLLTITVVAFANSKETAQPTSPAEGYVEIVYILDKSGSMSPYVDDTIGGFNQLVKEQAQSGPTKLTTILFDHSYTVLFENVDAKDAVLSKENYRPGGTTALLDAIGKSINDMEALLNSLPDNEKPTKVIFVISTDGQENASREFTREAIAKMIKDKQTEYGWEFVFVGANIDTYSEASSLGISSDNVVDYRQSTEGNAVMFEQTNKQLLKLR